MANPNKSARDPIIQDSPGTAGGSVKNASAGRVKSISGGGPNFTKNPGSTDSKGTGGGFPVPNSPYGSD